jgi:hypothetical protein
MKPTKYCSKKEGEGARREISKYNRGGELVQSTLYAFMESSQ